MPDWTCRRPRPHLNSPGELLRAAVSGGVRVTERKVLKADGVEDGGELPDIAPTRFVDRRNFKNYSVNVAYRKNNAAVLASCDAGTSRSVFAPGILPMDVKDNMLSGDDQVGGNSMNSAPVLPTFPRLFQFAHNDKEPFTYTITCYRP